MLRVIHAFAQFIGAGENCVQLCEQGGSLRISESLASFDQKLISALAGLPAGSSLDGFSLALSLLSFAPPRHIKLDYMPMN